MRFPPIPLTGGLTDHDINHVHLTGTTEAGRGNYTEDFCHHHQIQGREVLPCTHIQAYFDISAGAFLLLYKGDISSA